MSYTRYAGDRFVGPTGLTSSFPTDVADGAILVTSGNSSTDQALYVKVDGSWEQVVQTGVVLQNMTGHFLDQYSPQDIYAEKTFHELVTINNLTVTGTQTILNTVDSSIKDNLIILNSGESGAGITLQSGGIQIDRGSAADANILFDETITGRDSHGALYNEAFNFNFEVHVTGDRLLKSSETGIFQTMINSVHETGITSNASTSSFLLTGVDTIYDIDGVVVGEAAHIHQQQVQCYVGGVLQMPLQYTLANALGGTGQPTLTFSENLFSGVKVDFVYSASVRAT